MSKQRAVLKTEARERARRLRQIASGQLRVGAVPRLAPVAPLVLTRIVELVTKKDRTVRVERWVNRPVEPAQC